MTARSCTRVYEEGGQVAHLREDVAPAEFILCRRYDSSGDLLPGYPQFFDAGWLGTGSQEEYEQAAGLPLCRDCAKAAGAR